VSPALPLIRLEGISKSFGRNQANRDISLDIQAGKIKALLGENGAGKSTLMSILSGRLQPDQGRILLEGVEMPIRSTHRALELGIGMVYQHFTLVDAMTVAENVVLGQTSRFWLSPGRVRRDVSHLAEKFGMPIDPGRKVYDLSMGERQRVEILKLLYRDSRVLIFDEPTAVLTPQEVDELFVTLRSMVSQGHSIVFISHKLDEVRAIANRVTVLRHGKVTAAGVARFPHAVGRIPHFAEAERAAALLSELTIWKRANVVKVDTSAPLLPVRRNALRDGKIVYLATPGLRSERCFLELDPSKLGNRASVASNIRGALQCGRRVTPNEMRPVDLVLVGSGKADALAIEQYD